MGILVIACILSAILYRMGGSSKWNTRYRDIGCSLVLLGLVGALFGLKLAFWWVYLITFGLSWGALSAYWRQDEKRWGYWVHGLGCGLAGLPLLFIIPWYFVFIRLFVCTLGMMIWSEFIGNDVMEECGRGVFFIL